MTVSALILISGCRAESGPSMNSGTPQSPSAPIGQADASYRRLLADLQERLITGHGVLPFSNDREVIDSGCTDDAQGVIRRYSSGRSESALDGEQWHLVEREVTQFLAAHGFDAGRVIVDRPGDHEVMFSRPDGAQIWFGSKSTTMLTLTSACHAR